MMISLMTEAELGRWAGAGVRKGALILLMVLQWYLNYCARLHNARGWPLRTSFDFTHLDRAG